MRVEKWEYLENLAAVMGNQDLALFCPDTEVSSESYGSSIADIELEARDRARFGARAFIGYLAENGKLHPLTDRRDYDACRFLETYIISD